jgi:hypothetical protein
MFEAILNKFQLRFKDRIWAANVLAQSIKDLIKKQRLNGKDMIVMGIPEMRSSNCRCCCSKAEFKV